ncbi:hypothetical protein Ari01nite_41040 [Paractinoplanes rishiriensis]|uniref:Uncharacterized protein n=1 Tax=Paractinoplanes rishiriensis TaxID=1050105 RepID=A0A919MVP7_9ACTN|nr:hypothetical protein Ari01nite_41040 [Actinoplanes rishiriensis]
MAANQVADAAGIVRHIGRAGRPAEVAAAIADCRQAALLDEASAIIVYAAQRMDPDHTRIMMELLDIGETDAVRELLTRRLERR